MILQLANQLQTESGKLSLLKQQRVQNWLSKTDVLEADYLGLKLQGLQQAIEVKPIQFGDALNINVGGMN